MFLIIYERLNVFSHQIQWWMNNKGKGNELLTLVVSFMFSEVKVKIFLNSTLLLINSLREHKVAL